MSTERLYIHNYLTFFFPFVNHEIREEEEEEEEEGFRELKCGAWTFVSFSFSPLLIETGF